MVKKNIVILGSSGSIGESALAVVRQFRDRFRVLGLSVNSNVHRLAAQVEEFRPRFVAIRQEDRLKDLTGPWRRKTRVLSSMEGVCRLAALKDADLVLLAIAGSEAILPFLSAIDAKKTIALANKEAVVMAGSVVLPMARKNNVRIIPVDSEQNAIFQCLQGYCASMIGKVYLTASGGPLLGWTQGQINGVGLKKVLAHPRWKMGRKISVDSATLMNKGLEVIEAQQLFGLRPEQIKVVIHPQSFIHSMVEFVDGSILAQMAVADMKLPIQYAFSFPQRWPNEGLKANPLTLGPLSFLAPDERKFPSLRLAYEAAAKGGVSPCVLNAANEAAVAAFLEQKLGFTDIARVVEKTARQEFCKNEATLEEIFEADKRARLRAGKWIDFYGRKGKR